MKEEFEVWARMKEVDLTPFLGETGWEWDYQDIQTQLYWECWQAARVINTVSP